MWVNFTSVLHYFDVFQHYKAMNLCYIEFVHV